MVIVQDYRFYLDILLLDVNSTSAYQDIMLLQADPGVCPVISINNGNRFKVDTPTQIYQSIYMNLNISSTVTQIPQYTKAQFLDSITEYDTSDNAD